MVARGIFAQLFAAAVATSLARMRRLPGTSALLQKLQRLQGENVADAAPKQPKVLFGDIKERVRESLLTKTYDVKDLYRTTGIWQRIARHPIFEAITLGIVALNTVWMGIDMDLSSSPSAAPMLAIIENAFCAYFTFEWFVRLRAFRKKREGLRDSWFLFDSFLVSTMLLETIVMSLTSEATGVGSLNILRLARLLRLTRVARTVRLFRAVPELMILVKGMMAAIRSVGTTLLLLLLLLYVFALVFRQLADASPVLKELYFGSVWSSMYTLLMHGVFMDDMGLTMRTIGEQSTVAVLLFWAFVLISSLTVMNMLIAVICEAVSSVAAAEKEMLVANFLKNSMRQLFPGLDNSDDGRISKEDFVEVLGKPAAVQLLSEVGLDVVALVDRVDAIFMAEDVGGKSQRTLSLGELTELMLSLRGNCVATVRDVLDLRKFMRTIVSQTNDNLCRIDGRLVGLEAASRASVGLPGASGVQGKHAVEGVEPGS